MTGCLFMKVAICSVYFLKIIQTSQILPIIILGTFSVVLPENGITRISCIHIFFTIKKMVCEYYINIPNSTLSFLPHNHHAGPHGYGIFLENQHYCILFIYFFHVFFSKGNNVSKPNSVK